MINFKEKLIRISNNKKRKVLKSEIKKIKQCMKDYAGLGYFHYKLTIFKGEDISVSILELLKSEFPDFEIHEGHYGYGYGYTFYWGENK